MRRTTPRPFRLAMIACCLGCGGVIASGAPAAPAAAPDFPAAMRGLRAHVAGAVAIVVEGDGEPGLGERIRAAVEAELGAAGIILVPSGNEPNDFVVRIETRVRSAVYFLRGHVSLSAEHAGATVAQISTDDELHRDSEFAAVMAHKAVVALLRSPALAGLADRKTARHEVATTRPSRPAVPFRNPAATAAKAHYVRGTSFYNLNRFREALTEYEAAYMAVQDPPFLFNIAQCYRKLGEDKQAVDFYRSYLRVAPNAPNRAEVQRHITELERNDRTSR